MDVTARKDSVRRLALAARKRMGPEDRAAASVAIAQAVRGLPEFLGAASVLVSVSMHSEVSTDEILSKVLGRGKTLLIPFVADDGTLRATPVASLDELSPGYRGIPEPRARFPVSLDTASMIVVPGVAFDLHGRRLGYGGGFFDGLLADAPDVPIVGLCFEAQIVPEVPTEAHDCPVTILVTEERIIRPSL